MTSFDHREKWWKEVANHIINCMNIKGFQYQPFLSSPINSL
jgi:hypothetical protein